MTQGPIQKVERCYLFYLINQIPIFDVKQRWIVARRLGIGAAAKGFEAADIAGFQAELVPWVTDSPELSSQRCSEAHLRDQVRSKDACRSCLPAAINQAPRLLISLLPRRHLLAGGCQ